MVGCPIGISFSRGSIFRVETLGFREGKWAGMSFASKVSHTWHPRVVFFVEIVTKSPFLMFGHGVKREFSMSQTWTKALVDLFVNPSEQLGLPKDSVDQWCMQRVRKTVGIYGAKTILTGYVPTIKRVHDHFHQFTNSLRDFLFWPGSRWNWSCSHKVGPLRSLYMTYNYPYKWPCKWVTGVISPLQVELWVISPTYKNWLFGPPYTLHQGV